VANARLATETVDRLPGIADVRLDGKPVNACARSASIGLLLAAGTLLVAFDPATTWWFPSCPLHALTGWLCPLCGSLRALHALLLGAPVAALAFNPLIIVGLVAWLLAGKRTAAFCFSARGLAVLIAFGVLRNVHGPSLWLGH
jgi:hypothetical protein